MVPPALAPAAICRADTHYTDTIAAPPAADEDRLTIWDNIWVEATAGPNAETMEAGAGDRGTNRRVIGLFTLHQWLGPSRVTLFGRHFLSFAGRPGLVSRFFTIG